MMKGLIWTIVAIAVIVALVFWTKGANTEAPVVTSEATSVAEPETTTPTAAPVQQIKSVTKNGMKIEILTEGTGTGIVNGQTAEVDYSGALTDGTIFDASARHGSTFSFPLGAGRVIKGWDQGVLGMKIGETRRLTIPSELAYGASGIPGTIPPNATLIFEVTLKAIK